MIQTCSFAFLSREIALWTDQLIRFAAGPATRFSRRVAQADLPPTNNEYDIGRAVDLSLSRYKICISPTKQLVERTEGALKTTESTRALLTPLPAISGAAPRMHLLQLRSILCKPAASVVALTTSKFLQDASELSFVEIRTDPHGYIREITCIGHDEAQIPNVVALLDRHVRYLNHLEERIQDGLVDDIAEYLSQKVSH